MKLLSRFIKNSLLHHFSRVIWSNFSWLTTFLVFSLAFFPNMSFSTDNDATEQIAPSGFDNTKQFEYKLENRPDPFVPFISEKAASSNINMDEIVDSGEPLTGMQLFEPGQLTLVALLKKGDENIAMVQDFTGKGYVLTEGTKIGRRGIVKNFMPQSVIIEETAVTRAGKKTVTEVVMLLKKEGEK
ncbi:MAG: pilus assembly protein PilP [Pseudomonadota bacterium]